MTERFITVLLTLFISVFALRLDATSIVILEEKGAYGDFLQNIQQWKENFRDVLTGNVAGKKKLGAFEVAYVKGHRLLTRAEVLRDVDKHDQAEGKKWHELTLEAGVAVPWMLPLATLLGPVNVAIEANGKVAATKQYRIVMPDVLSLAEDEQSKAGRADDRSAKAHYQDLQDNCFATNCYAAAGDVACGVRNQQRRRKNFTDQGRPAAKRSWRGTQSQHACAAEFVVQVIAESARSYWGAHLCQLPCCHR